MQSGTPTQDYDELTYRIENKTDEKCELSLVREDIDDSPYCTSEWLTRGISIWL